MRAAWFEKFGAAADVLVVDELDTPVAGPGEVLVRLHNSGVNPSDVKKRSGSFPNLLDGGLVIPNSDGAGIIAAVGKAVDTSRIGERVWVYQAQFARRLGTAAEYVALDSSRVAPLPDNAGFDVGACLGIPAMTAHRCVFADGDVSGQSIVVTGAAGRVGYYAVQWASQAGATVIATASNTEDAAACKAAGAAHVVNHRSDSFAGDILAANGGVRVDRAIDLEFGANLATWIAVVATSGTIATYGSVAVPEPTLPFFQLMYMDMNIRFIIVYAMPEAAKQHAIADIHTALANDALHPRIAATFPLQDIAAANELIEKGTIRGAVILNIE
ncbi:MAG: NADPH:quinone reductase [Gammaproteobacteria bacterium]|nr:NADPH:quinone reductase [Gammaproteobacteria bacterium]MBT5789418.1 NADPH:quinone reductase [Gammaproteobacteria bacterium]MBT6572291.1 NADPH:quinone reductase [Gammaproteobacteria bacterium]MBT6663863.1 NADPH:quinone reductase [Gammaproteobacteria bacterium]MBT7176318.1 NADPH:quinone reductase [Gammaproteobacteria bacterium]